MPPRNPNHQFVLCGWGVLYTRVGRRRAGLRGAGIPMESGCLAEPAGESGAVRCDMGHISWLGGTEIRSFFVLKRAHPLNRRPDS